MAKERRSKMKINNTKHMAVLFGFVMSIFLISTTNVFAQEEQGFDKKEHHKEWQAKKAKMFEELGITEEQKQALKVHRESHRGEMNALREQIKEKRKAFRQALEDPNVDEGAITATNNEIKTLTNSLADNRLDGVLEVRKILTPQQFQKFNEMKKKRNSKRRGESKGSRHH